MKLIRELLESVHPSLDEIVAELVKVRPRFVANFYQDEASTNIQDMHDDPEIQKALAARVGQTASLRAETLVHPNGMEEDLTIFLDLRMKDATLTVDAQSTAYAEIPTETGQGIVEHKETFTFDTSGKTAEQVITDIAWSLHNFIEEVESGLEAESEGWDEDEEGDDESDS